MDDKNLHNYLGYDTALPKIGIVNEIVAYIINHGLGEKHSVTKLRKMGKLTLAVRKDAKSPLQNVSFRFDDLATLARSSRSYAYSTFGLPRPLSWLLDSPNALARNFHVLLPNHEEAITIQLQMPFGSTFPLKPALDREGIAFASFQVPIQRNILSLRHAVVERGASSVTTESDWLNSLRMLINECVSIVEITLHQVYFAAEYGLKPGWSFDIAKLGLRHGRRLSDKFRWVGAVTGKHLDNAQAELESFNQLREVRNHLNHFDPPCFAASVEDVTRWCNAIPNIGKLLWKIRSKLDEMLTQELVELILLPDVVFVPRPSNSPRFPQTDGVGYRSSCWPISEAARE